MTKACIRIAALLCAVALAGCTGNGVGAPTASPTTGLRDRALPIWDEFVACARTHGQPNWPDPAIDDSGRATFADVAGFDVKTAYSTVRDACAPILEKLPPEANPRNKPVSDADLATLRRFAECVRAHGVPDWPDPDPNGSFPLPERITEGGKGLTYDAQQACKDIYDGKITGPNLKGTK
jgi:hypothetical protein